MAAPAPSDAWYYLDRDEEKIPFAETDLPELVKLGRIKSRTLLWQKGSKDWSTCGELFPSFFLPGATIAIEEDQPVTVGAIRRLGRPLLRHHGTQRLSAILLIALGTIACFTLVGLPAGAAFIFAGFQLLHAAGALRRGTEQGLEDEVRTGQNSLGTFWTFLGVAATISALTLLTFLLFMLLSLFDVVNFPESWIEFFQKDAPSTQVEPPASL